MRCENMIASTRKDFSVLSMVTDSWIPACGVWVGDYPYLDRKAFREFVATVDPKDIRGGKASRQPPPEDRNDVSLDWEIDPKERYAFTDFDMLGADNAQTVPLKRARGEAREDISSRSNGKSRVTRRSDTNSNSNGMDRNNPQSSLYSPRSPSQRQKENDRFQGLEGEK
jgi:hypothetical protein